MIDPRGKAKLSASSVAVLCPQASGANDKREDQIIADAWINPLSYVFRAFGVDAFSFAGDRLQRTAAVVGGASATAIAVSLFVFLNAAWQS